MTNTMSRLRQREGGFTLVELMIVIVVLGILAGIVIFAVGTFQTNAEDAEDDANARNCRTAQAAAEASTSGAAFETYFADVDGDGTGDPPEGCTAPATSP